MHELANVAASDCNQSTPQTITIQNCDKNLLLTKSTPINGDVNTHDDAKSVLINNRTKIGDESTEYSIGDGDRGALTNNCDKNVGDSISEVNTKALPKPILNSNGRSAGTLSKKSVSFDTDDEKIKKFINGDVIVDKQNPFRSANAKRREEFFRRDSEEKPVILAPDEFVTTEDVLKESKYVKTYVKNPDRYFEYDPTLKARLQKEEEAEQKRYTPVRRSKLSRSTNERLKEIKSKFSPTTILYAQPKVFSSSSDEVDSRFLNRNRNRNIDKRYPDLSQIKVKVGTDIEKSLFNPEEVALNALKFDARIKNSSFGSQDDLDDIADLTSTSVESVIENQSVEKTNNETSVEKQEEEDQPKQTFTNTVSSKEFQEFLKKKGLTLLPESRRLQPKTDRIVDTSDLKIEETAEMESKKTKKPSVLQRLFPSRMLFSKRRTTPKEPVPEPKKLYSTLSDDEVNRTPGVKRVVLERQSYHAGNSSEPTYIKNFNQQKQMMDDGSSSISSALTNAESYVDMNVAVPVPRKRTENKENYIDMKTKWGDQNGSNNGTLDKERYFQNSMSRKSDIDSSKSSLGVRYIDSSSSNNTVMCDTPGTHHQSGDKPLVKVRQTPSGRSSVPIMSPSERLEYHRNNYNNSAIPISIKNRKEPVSFRYNSPDTNDGIVRPRVQRLPISTDTKTSNKLIAESDNVDNQPLNPPIPMKRNLERQSLNYKKPINAENSTYGNLNRTVSLDKNEMKKRNPPKPLERSKPVQSLAISQRIPRNESSNDKSPKTPNEIYLGVPQSTSTPIVNPEQQQFKSGAKNANGDFYFHKKPKTVSPIVTVSADQPPNYPEKKLELDTYSWAKLRELKEQTDRQLYSKPLVIQTDSAQQRVYGRPASNKRENIYEKLPHQAILSTPVLNSQKQFSLPRKVLQPQQHLKLIHLQPTNQQQQPSQQQLQQQQHQQQQQQQNFVRNSPQRNTVGNFYRNKDGKVIDGRNVDEFGFVQLEQNHFVQSHPPPTNTQPPRCQSVLDNMTSRDIYGSIQSQTPGNSVIFRKKPIGGMSREEIMSKVQEFCRKSMNNTPTRNLKGSVDQLSHRGGIMNRTSSSEISPVSYTSLDSRATHSIASSRSSARLAPQVPQRVQSLQKDNNHYQSSSPIYAPVNKRGSIQSTSSDVFYSPVNKRVNQIPIHREQQRHLTYSDSDSVFIANESNQNRVPVNQLASPQRIIVLNGDQISPQQVIAYQTPVPNNRVPSEEIYTTRQNDIYGRVYPHNPTYGYIQRNGSAPSQIYFTNINNDQKRTGMDGRATPLILHAIHQQPVQQVQQVHLNGGQMNYGGGRSGAIVVLENVDEIYRPIVPNKVIPQSRQIRQNFVRSGNHIVPYESESCSEAEEVQRIMQNRGRGE